MKIWEILKEENVGKEYKDNMDNEYKVKRIWNNCLEIYDIREEQIANFTAYDVITLEFEEIQHKLTGWERVDKYKIYFCIDDEGDVLAVDDWNEQRDDIQYNYYNYFSTKEKAEEVKDMNLLQRMMMKFYDEEDGQVDWNDRNKRKYICYYHYIDKEYYISWAYIDRCTNEVYFSSRELAQRCIDEVIKPFMEGK